eukprot:jgi/Mesen1/10436/ME000082S09944
MGCGRDILGRAARLLVLFTFICHFNCNVAYGADTITFSLTQADENIEAICLNASSSTDLWTKATFFMAGQKASVVDGRTLCANSMDYQSYSSASETFTKISAPPGLFKHSAFKVSTWSSLSTTALSGVKFVVNNKSNKKIKVAGIKDTALASAATTVDADMSKTYQVPENGVLPNFTRSLDMLTAYVANLALNAPSLSSSSYLGVSINSQLVVPIPLGSGNFITQTSATVMIQPLAPWLGIYSFYLFQTDLIETNLTTTGGRRLSQTAEETSYLQAQAAACPGGYCYPNPSQ